MSSKFRRWSEFTFALITLLFFGAGALGQVEHFPAGHIAPATANQAWAPAMQTAPPVVNPLPAMEARARSPQCQLDSMPTICNNVGCQGCSKSCGNACGNTCCNTRSCGLYFGAAAVFAKPHFKEAFQYSETNVVTGQQTLIPFGYDYQATPRVWLGFKRSDGFGLRVAYWHYDADGRTSSNVADGFNIYGAHAVSIIFPANILAINPGEQLINSDSLKTQIVNYYATYDGNVGNFEVSGGVGLRQASLEQALNSVVLDPGGSPIRQLNWEREFKGVGPSISIDAKRRLGYSPFSFFANGGGALIFGTKSLNRTVLGDQSPQPASPFLTLEDADEVVGIGEIGLGLEWSRQLNRGHNLAVRGSYEGQLWAEAGAPTIGFLGFEGFGVALELGR